MEEVVEMPGSKDKKYGCPKSIIKNSEYFCTNDGTRCHAPCDWYYGWKWTIENVQKRYTENCGFPIATRPVCRHIDICTCGNLKRGE